MRMIISPAKKMRTDPDGLAAVGLPRFRDKAERVKQALQRLTAEVLGSDDQFCVRWRSCRPSGGAAIPWRGSTRNGCGEWTWSAA